MALHSKRGKIFWGLLAVAGVLLLGLGAVLYLLTRPVEIEFAQDPNPLEAHEANRKLDLLNDAREGKRLGFIRLSEVEINSFLNTRYNDPKNLRTNLPVRIVKTGVLLHETNLTFITWIQAPVLGMTLPFVWQRTATPTEENDKWTFEEDSMRVGRIDIPKMFWPKLNSLLGQSDGIFEERRVWLANLPKIALMKNELSLASELRLFSYRPEDKGGL